ncbi:hypothetical protein F5X98DRAFT_381622 [Xylaria grammica]|nr:hypothetical protein F5X98DRAFT_381622 [Xylaria grammica]
MGLGRSRQNRSQVESGEVQSGAPNPGRRTAAQPVQSRSKSPSSRSPISRNRRERPKARSPILPPSHLAPSSSAETVIEELVKQSLIRPLHTSAQPPHPHVIETQPLADGGPVNQPILNPTPPRQTTDNQAHDKDTSRHVVRQKATKALRFDPLSKPDSARTRPSKRSPIQPPRSTITADPLSAELGEEELLRRPQIRPPSQPQPEIRDTLADKRLAPQRQDPGSNQTKQPCAANERDSAFG